MPDGKRRPGRKPGPGPRHDAKEQRHRSDSAPEGRRRDDRPPVEPPPPPAARAADEPGLPTATVLVKAKRARPFFGRHPWVLDTAIERVEGTPADGDVVDLATHEGRFIARGIWNASSRLRVRLYAFDAGVPLDAPFWRSRIQTAVALRRTLGLDDRAGAARLINSEGDDLSGLIVDRYGDSAPGVLDEIVRGDEPFRATEGAIEAYARAWALTAFLAQTRKAALVDYITAIGAKPPLAPDGPEERLQDFVAAFGVEPHELEQPLMKFLARWKD